MNAPATAAALEPLVLTAASHGVARITINRPRQFNAMSREILDALSRAVETFGADPAVRVVVLAGAGSAFSGGHDLKEMMANRNEAYLGELFAACSQLMLAIRALPQPVIARVQGTATAAGCQLVAACDLAVAAADARFATSGINFGLFCATPAVPLSRNIAQKRAFEMLFTGEFIDAATALDWGLVNRVVPAASLDEELARLCERIAEKPRDVVASGKALFYRQLEAPLPDAYGLASRSIARNMLGEEAAEGVAAFIGKRKPNWR